MYVNVRVYICSTLEGGGLHANFRQPRQKLTLCTALLSLEASLCTGQLRCQTTSDELRVVRGFVHRMLPTCGLHFSRLITFLCSVCLTICHNKNVIFEQVFFYLLGELFWGTPVSNFFVIPLTLKRSVLAIYCHEASKRNLYLCTDASQG